jgi:hypothetical protein
VPSYDCKLDIEEENKAHTVEAEVNQMENDKDPPSTCFKSTNTKDVTTLHESHMFYFQNHLNMLVLN